MDLQKVKKRRTVERAATTKVLNELRDESLSKEEVHVKVDTLRKKEASLVKLDEDILNLMLDEPNNDEACVNEVDRARMVMEEIERVCSSALARFIVQEPTPRIVPEAPADASFNDDASSASSDRSKVKVKSSSILKLPKVPLEKFDLSPSNWSSFYGQFERVHTDETLTNSEKFQFLRSTLLGRAKQLVENFTFSDDTYDKAITMLKDRYGRKDLIVNEAYKELIALIRSKPDLMNLYDVVSAKISCLASYGITNDQVALLLPLIVDCLPLDSRRQWERRSFSFNENEDRLKALIDFIGMEAEAEERISSYKLSTSIPPTKIRSTAATLVTTPKPSSNEPSKCIFCSGSHANKDCTKVMSVNERRELVKQNRCCFACLACGHSVKTCRTKEKLSCKICKGKHRHLCCYKELQPNEKAPTVAEKPNSDAPSASSPSCFAGPTKGTTVMMQTLVAMCNNRKVRILIDSGSHRSYASREICKTGTKVGTETFSHMLFGGESTQQTTHSVFDIELKSLYGKGSFALRVLEQEHIVGPVPNLHFADIRQRFEREGIILSEDDQCRPIEILIGADVMAKLVTGVRSVCNLLAFETKLGWCAVGTFNDTSMTTTSNIALSMLSLPLPSLWDLETLGIERPTNKKATDECVQHFKENVKFEDGYYSVALPWIEGHPPISTDCFSAETRLKQVLKKLDSNLYNAYDAVFAGWEDAGIIERIDDKNETTGHYLPHRPVLKEGKTTKVRPVFDASNKIDGVSLNDCLHAGPNMISNLLNLLIRFRYDKVGMIADVKQAFLMIRLGVATDKDMLRFLWQRDGKIIMYRHCRVVFGLTSSPFLLNATITHHLQKFDSAIAERLRNSFYVDDAVMSLESYAMAEEFKREAASLMERAGFDLRGWVTTGDEGSHYVLGIRWNSKEDVIGVRKPQFSIAESYSKKELLSLIGKIYDPLGILAAPVLYLKFLLQECFKLKLTWEEPVPRNISQSINQWLSEIDLIDSIMVQRSLRKDNATLTLHAFSDASCKGLGSCIFLRCETNMEVTVNLVTSKARVTPTETMTIPRLELVAALLTARLADNVLKAIQVESTTYWCDSMIVLFWIRKGEWRTFVGNRVKEIRSLSDVQQWRFIEGERNPADIVSRSCLLSQYSKWLKGPTWLREEKENWPTVEIQPTAEALKEGITMINTTIPSTTEFVRSHKFSKNVRILAYILRFVQNARKKSQTNGDLTMDEIRIAEKKLLIMCQTEYGVEMKGIATYKDDDGLVRVKTKILSEQFSKDFKSPIVLPQCDIVEDLVEECHYKHTHAGATTVLSFLREDYWIVKGRRLVRRVLNRCLRCRLRRAQSVKTPPIGLPNNRTDLGKAFEVTGCDLAGPLYLRNQSKVWIVLFTCAVYRAVHLEIVESLSTEDFLMALRRFVARRGRVLQMYSDNGTNFVGAWNLINATEVQHEMKLKWIFNVPTAAWWGGFWERLIGVMKNLLRASLGKALLSLNELNTVLIEVEATMNARPITYFYDDPSELRPISPAMFLQESLSTETVALDAIDSSSLTHRVRYINEIRKQLRTRFKKEYLGQLLLKSSKPCDPIRIGEIVWLMSEKPKVEWPLAKVVEVYRGKDNNIRAVKLLTENGEYVRPVQKLCRLEVGGESSNFDNVPLNDVSNDSTTNYDLLFSENDETELANELSNNTPSVTKSGRVVRKPKLLDL